MKDGDDKRISIVTIAYNAFDEGLESTVCSVISQKTSGIEYVLIDGGSTDRSSEVYSKYFKYFDYFVSEKDFGISDAFNKGVRFSRGEYIWFVNAGDTIHEGAVEELLRFLEKSDAAIIYGDMIWLEGGIALKLVPAHDYEKRIKYVMPFLHPSTLMRKSVFERVGFFDIRLKRAMDYDLALRAYLAGFRAAKIDQTLASMSAGGVHDVNYLATLEEVCRVSVFSGGSRFVAATAKWYTYLNRKMPLLSYLKRWFFN